MSHCIGASLAISQLGPKVGGLFLRFYLFTGNTGDDATQFVVKPGRVKDRIKVFCDEFRSHKVFGFYGDSIDVLHKLV